MHTAEWPIGPLCCAKPKHNQAENTHPSRLGHCRTSSRWKSPQTPSMVGKTSVRVTRLHPRHLATSVWFQQSTLFVCLFVCYKVLGLAKNNPLISRRLGVEEKKSTLQVITHRKDNRRHKCLWSGSFHQLQKEMQNMQDKLC